MLSRAVQCLCPSVSQSPNWFLIALVLFAAGRADYSQFARSGTGNGGGDSGGAINAAFEVFPAKVDSREGANTVRKQEFRVPAHF